MATLGVQVTDTGGNSDWLLLAACKDAPAEVFFPEGGCRSRVVREAVKHYCGRCPVWNECFENSFHANKYFGDLPIDEEGIWAGLIKTDRKRYRNDPAKAKALVLGIETR